MLLGKARIMALPFSLIGGGCHQRTARNILKAGQQKRRRFHLPGGFQYQIHIQPDAQRHHTAVNEVLSPGKQVTHLHTVGFE